MEFAKTVNSADPVPLSVLILTHNEALNIAECLRSVEWASEILVVDSFSDDQTVEIARAAGASAVSHHFEGYAAQRNWALDNLPFSHEWLLMLDADERVTPDLAREIAEIIRQEGQGHSGYHLAPRLIFMGRWLRHGGLYPTWILRLFKRQCGRLEDRPVNERTILRGTAGYLENPLDHCDNRPLSAWIAKHNRYAELEAEEYFQEKFQGGYGIAIPPRWWGSQAERKRWIKLKVWNRLPLFVRPFLFFFRNYILKAGFLDGRQGLLYHVLWSFWVRFLIDSTIFECRIRSEAVSAEQARERV
jgi:glycosyltransferase involved in cell wall biosynthesis